MEDFDKWEKASLIAAEALQYGKTLIKPGASFLDVTEKVELKIAELGGQCAFPAQMSLNEVAAHFTVDPGEDIIFEDQLVSLDIGVHIDGCIGDTALTVDLSGKYTDLVQASRDALDNAIKVVQVGTPLSEIGKVIHDTITGFGYSPIKNLSGHGLSPYNIHDRPSVPNFDTGDTTKLKRGMVIAIEPFATTGAGMIYESGIGNIFSQVGHKPVRSSLTRPVLQHIETYKNLPFTTRWLVKRFSIGQVRFALRELSNLGVIRDYPPLPDRNKGMVSQAEHTLYIDDKVKVLTRL